MNGDPGFSGPGRRTVDMSESAAMTNGGEEYEDEPRPLYVHVRFTKKFDYWARR